MSNLFFTLPGGVIAIAVIFILLYSVTSMSGKMVAVVMAFAVVATYVPISIFIWPGADVFSIHIALYMVTVYILGIVMNNRDARRKAGQKGFGFHWAPAAIITFFIILIIMDSFFIMFATKGMESHVAEILLPKPQSGGKVSSHFPGTVSKNYHQKYSEYNEYLERFEAQKLRNWSVRKGWLGEVTTNTPAIFRVEIKDDKNTAVKDAKVSGQFLRAADSKLDQSFEMREIEPGAYQQSVTLPKPGSWKLVLKIVKDKDVHEIHATTTVK